MMRVNLIPAPRIRAARAVRRLKAWCVVWVLGTAGCLAVLGWSWSSISRRSSTDATTRAHIDARTGRARGEAARLTKELSDETARLAAAEAVGAGPDWSVLLALVSREIGPDQRVAFESCSLVPERAEGTKGAPGPGPSRRLFRISGVARAQPDINALVLRLEEFGLFDRVAFESRIREGFTEPLVAFEVTCVLDEGGPP